MYFLIAHVCHPNEFSISMEMYSTTCAQYGERKNVNGRYQRYNYFFAVCECVKYFVNRLTKLSVNNPITMFNFNFLSFATTTTTLISFSLQTTGNVHERRKKEKYIDRDASVVDVNSASAELGAIERERKGESMMAMDGVANVI